MNELRSAFGMNISYNVALRGRNCAIQMIYGKYEESFNMLPGYLHVLKETNPNTITEIEISFDGRFKHVFVALGATQVTYPMCMRPVIIVDGTHLKGKNNGILFVAVAKDANEQLYPLAFGIGPIENHASWTFFMRGLRKAYGELESTLIVSDQHISIIHAVSIVFPKAHHGLCYYHLSKNLSNYGKTVVGLFQRAAYTYDITEYNKRLEQIRSLKPQAYQKLMEIGSAKWSRLMCPVRRFSNLTSNAAESFNNTLLWARRLPICACLDAVRIIIEEWFNERRAACRRDEHPITEEARKKIAMQIDYARTYNAMQRTEVEFTIRTAKRTLSVNLQAMKCECLRWQLDCLPCAHAIAAIMFRREEVVDYVSSYYKRTTYVNSYELPILRVPHKAEWTLPAELQHATMLPPIKTRLPGRARENRRRGRGEGRRGNRRGPVKCRYCDSTDHIGAMCHLWMQ